MSPVKSDLSPAHKDICVALSCVMPRHQYQCMEDDYSRVRPAEACCGYCAPGDGASALPRKKNHFPPAGNGFPWWHHPALREVFHRCLPFPQICFAPTCEEPHACAFVNDQETVHLTARLRHPLDSGKNPLLSRLEHRISYTPDAINSVTTLAPCPSVSVISIPFRWYVSAL